jgi:hypothetical protein
MIAVENAPRIARLMALKLNIIAPALTENWLPTRNGVSFNCF